MERSELSLVFCDNPFIQRLNREWREKDRPTDVLSFPAAEPAELEAHRRDPGANPLVLGDIVISLDVVHERVGEADETREIARLLIHGIVHLLGHDHEQDNEAVRMERLEGELLEGVETHFHMNT